MGIRASGAGPLFIHFNHMIKVTSSVHISCDVFMQIVPGASKTVDIQQE